MVTLLINIQHGGLRDYASVTLRSIRNAMEFVEGLRKRSVGFNSVKEGNNDKLSAGKKTPLRGRSPTIDAGSYWLTRIVFLRSLGFIYCKYC